MKSIPPKKTAPVSQRGTIHRGMKLILRLIRKERLSLGDKLPPQSELRRILGLTNFVISGAMQELVDAKAISRRGKAGTTFLGLDSLPADVFTIAVATTSPSRERMPPAVARIFTQSMASLFEGGLSTKTYFRGTVKEWTPAMVGDMHGLEEDVEEGEIDALLLPFLYMKRDDELWLARQGVPVVYCGARDDTFSGVIIDYRLFARDAAIHLATQGCKRLAIFSLDKPRPNLCMFWDGFQEGLAHGGLTSKQGELLCANLVVGPEGGILVAREVLGRHAADRPDGIIFTDDWLAQGFCQAIATSNYRPRMAVMTNLQEPINFPLPLALFQLDLAQLAARSVQMVVGRLKDPTRSDEVLRLAPKLKMNGKEINGSWELESLRDQSSLKTDSKK